MIGHAKNAAQTARAVKLLQTIAFPALLLNSVFSMGSAFLFVLWVTSRQMGLA